MRAIKKILVAVKRPGVGQAATLRKAVQLAVGLGAELELFHALTTPIYLGPVPGDDADWRRVRDREQARAMARLERTAVRLRRSGARVSVNAVWDYPSFGALLRRVHQSGAGMIVAERHAGGHTAPWLLRYTDWELLRQSPVPVLLVKKSRAWRRPVLLAGLDPFHEFAKPAKLDREILDIGGVLAEALGGTLHAAHVYLAPSFRAGAGAEGRALVDMYQSRARDSAEAALRRELKSFDIPPATGACRSRPSGRGTAPVGQVTGRGHCGHGRRVARRTEAPGGRQYGGGGVRCARLRHPGDQAGGLSQQGAAPGARAGVRPAGRLRGALDLNTG